MDHDRICLEARTPRSIPARHHRKPNLPTVKAVHMDPKIDRKLNASILSNGYWLVLLAVADEASSGSHHRQDERNILSEKHTKVATVPSPFSARLPSAQAAPRDNVNARFELRFNTS